MNRNARSCLVCMALAVLAAGCSPKQDAAQTSPVATTPAAPVEIPGTPVASAAETAAYAKLQPLLQRNCLMCHSAKPILPAYRVAPVGVVLETPEQMRALAPRVLAVVVTTHQMPPQNLIAMSDEDRQLLAAAIHEGWPGQ